MAGGERRSTRSRRASDGVAKEQEAAETVLAPAPEAKPEEVLEALGTESVATTKADAQEAAGIDAANAAEPPTPAAPEEEKPRVKEGERSGGVVKSKIEEPVKSPRRKAEEKGHLEKQSSKRKEEGPQEAERKDSKPKDNADVKESSRSREKAGEERKDQGKESVKEGARKEAPEKREQGRGDVRDRKREDKDKIQERPRSDRPRESDRRKEDERSKRPEKERADKERAGKEGDRKRDDEKTRHEDRKRESERHRSDRHNRKEDDRSKKGDDKSRKEDDRSKKDGDRVKAEDDKGRRDEDRGRREDASRSNRKNHSERKKDEETEKGAAPVALPPPPPLPPNAEVEKVNLDTLKEGGSKAPEKEPPPAKEKASRKEEGERREEKKRDGKDDKRGEEKKRDGKEDLAKDRGRSDRDKDKSGRRERSRSPARKADPRESERHRDRGRERDRGRRPPSPPRRKHRSRSRSLSPRDVRRRTPPRRASPRRRSPPSSSRPVNKRAGYYSSGLGGYSPRRRKNGDRDSPSLSPDRKRSKGMGGAWDQPPPGMDAAAIALWQQQVVVAQQAAAAAGANPFIAMGAASNLPNLNPLFPGMGGAQNPAVTRSQRRLYIGNLPPTVSDGELLEFLNAAIISGGSQHVPGTRPVSAVQLTLDKGFGFADFTHPEDATRAMLLDGIILHGNALKIRRPRDYVPNPSEMLTASAGGIPTAVGVVGVAGQPVITAPGTITTASSIPLSAIPQNIVPGFISTNVPDGPNKIFLGNIHPSITAEKMREILTAFGQLKHYVMKHNKNVKPFKVYAYVEYMDSAVTPQAVAGLSGLMLARKPLVAAYATPMVQLGSSDKEAFYGVPDAAKPLLEEPSKVLELTNILDRQQLLSLTDEEIEEIVEDATLECARFGTVKSSHLPRPSRSAKKEEEPDSKEADEDGTESKPGLLQNGEAVTVKEEPMDVDEKKEDGKVEEAEEDDDKKKVVLVDGTPAPEVKGGSAEDSEGVGKLYVEFSREESAIKAAHALHNRVYNQKRVGVAYLPVKVYQKLYGKGFGLSHKSYDERQELSIKVQDFLYGPV